MTRSYSTKRFSAYMLSLTTILLASSCVIYQNTPDYDDRIYSSRDREARKVVVVNGDEYKDYNENYFTKELERLDKINGTDILTDVENYTSINDDTIPDDFDNSKGYTSQSWGYNDSDDVVVNINLNNGYGWNTWNAWNIWDPYFGYNYFYPWGGSRFWVGGRNWGIGYNNFYNPWFYNGFYCPPYYGYYGYNGFGYRYNRGAYYTSYNGQRRYGRRLAYNNTHDRRVSTRRNNSTTFRRNSSVYRRDRGYVSSNRNITNSTGRRGNTSKVGENTNTRRNYNTNTSTERSRVNSSTRSSNSRSRASTNRSSSRSRSSVNRSSSRSRYGSSRSSSSRRRG